MFKTQLIKQVLFMLISMELNSHLLPNGWTTIRTQFYRAACQSWVQETLNLETTSSSMKVMSENK